MPIDSPDAGNSRGMKAGKGSVLLCSCEDTMRLDAGTVATGLDERRIMTCRHLCRSELALFREAAGRPGALTIACTQEAPLFLETLAEMGEKARIYGERYPIDEDFLAALAHMPEAAGCALGFDRLVMLATGVEHIDRVRWTPLD